MWLILLKLYNPFVQVCKTDTKLYTLLVAITNSSVSNHRHQTLLDKDTKTARLRQQRLLVLLSALEYSG